MGKFSQFFSQVCLDLANTETASIMQIILASVFADQKLNKFEGLFPVVRMTSLYLITDTEQTTVSTSSSKLPNQEAKRPNLLYFVFLK